MEGIGVEVEQRACKVASSLHAAGRIMALLRAKAQVQEAGSGSAPAA